MSDHSNSEDSWYFAYGSNMSIRRKVKRTGIIREAVLARLKGYRLAFNKKAARVEDNVYANVVVSPSDEVWGVAYLCNAEAMNDLDRWEGVASGNYQRQSVQLIVRKGETLQAVMYIADDDYIVGESKPSDKYLNHLLTGAQEHGLPPDYIAMIKRIANQGNEQS